MCKAKNASHIRTASTAAAEYPKAKTTNRRLHKIFDTTLKYGNNVFPPGQFAAPKYIELQTQDQTSGLTKLSQAQRPCGTFRPSSNELSTALLGCTSGVPAALRLEMGFSHTLFSPCFGASCTKCLFRMATLSWQKRSAGAKQAAEKPGVRRGLIGEGVRGEFRSRYFAWPVKVDTKEACEAKTRSSRRCSVI
jgi:hypothetical protein